MQRTLRVTFVVMLCGCWFEGPSLESTRTTSIQSSHIVLPLSPTLPFHYKEQANFSWEGDGYELQLIILYPADSGYHTLSATMNNTTGGYHLSLSGSINVATTQAEFDLNLNESPSSSLFKDPISAAGQVSALRVEAGRVELEGSLLRTIRLNTDSAPPIQHSESVAAIVDVEVSTTGVILTSEKLLSRPQIGLSLAFILSRDRLAEETQVH